MRSISYAHTTNHVAVCGEINEWETNEYVSDAIRLGKNKALIVTGHAASRDFRRRTGGNTWISSGLRDDNTAFSSCLMLLPTLKPNVETLILN